MIDPVQYQYHDSDGNDIWITFDPARPCIYCELPVDALSMGGPTVCPSCDCGAHRDGTKWSHHEVPALYKRAKRNMDALYKTVNQPSRLAISDGECLPAAKLDAGETK